MRALVGVTFLALVCAVSCGSSPDAAIVLDVDVDGTVAKTMITTLRVSVEGVSRDYAETSPLPASLGILTTRSGELSVSVVALGSGVSRGQWRGSVTAERGKTVRKPVLLTCDGIGCGNTDPVDGGIQDAGGHEGGVAGASGSTGGTIDASVDRPSDGASDSRVDSPTLDIGSKKGLGISCATSSECESDHCEEGVCCNTACAEPPPNYMANYGHACVSCVVAAHVGTCTALPAGTMAPTGQCLREYESTCGMDGTCDGKGGCRLFVAGTRCQVGSCSNDSSNVATSSRFCDGAHNCMSESKTSCGLYTCVDGACRPSCSSAADCSNGAQCSAGNCEGKAANGSHCTAGTDCLSGHCTDGYCCVSDSCSNGCFTCGPGLNNATPGTCQGSRCATCTCDGACHC